MRAGKAALICLCGDGKPKHLFEKHFGPIRFGFDRLTDPWIAASEMPGARTKRRDRRKRHDKPFPVQVFSPPSWSSHTWLR